MTKTLPLLAALLVPCAASLHASQPVTEDFESYDENTSAESAGWKVYAGNGSLDDLMVAAPQNGANTSSRCLTAKADSKDIQIVKPFDKPFDYAASSHQIVYTAKVVPQATGSLVHRVLFGVVTESDKLLSLFGAAGSKEGRDYFAFCVAEATSPEVYPAGDQFEIQLRIDTSKGLAKATGSLYVRNLSRHESDWQAADGLQNIPLYLEGAWNPADWHGWYIRSAYRREIDDLSLSAS